MDITQFTIIVIGILVVLIVVLFLPISYSQQEAVKQRMLIKPSPPSEVNPQLT